MQYLPLTLLLLGALLLTMTFAHMQHRYYLKVVNRLAADYRKGGMVLSSGIARGRLRGAIAILVIQRDAGIIERALIMEGSSILARFREHDELRGQTLSALATARLSKAARRAVHDAVERGKHLPASTGASDAREHAEEPETSSRGASATPASGVTPA